MQQYNIAAVNEAVAAANPDRPAIIEEGGRTLTYSELAARTRRLGSALGARGFGCHTERSDLAGHESGQDHLAIYLHNGDEYLESMLGAFKARMAPLNVNYRYVAEELRYLLDNARAKVVVYHDTSLRRSPRSCRTCPSSPSWSRWQTTRQRPAARRHPLRGPPGRRIRRAPPQRPSGHRTTSTSSTRVEPPACPRASSGASTTSSSRPWAAVRSERPRRIPTWTPSWRGRATAAQR